MKNIKDFKDYKSNLFFFYFTNQNNQKVFS